MLVIGLDYGSVSPKGERHDARTPAICAEKTNGASRARAGFCRALGLHVWVLRSDTEQGIIALQTAIGRTVWH